MRKAVVGKEFVPLFGGFFVVVAAALDPSGGRC
jgi:hypothetical protein